MTGTGPTQQAVSQSTPAVQHTVALRIPRVPGTQHRGGPLVQKFEAHWALFEQFASSGSKEAACAGVGTRVDKIAGKATMEVNPIFAIASRLDKPAQGD